MIFLLVLSLAFPLRFWESLSNGSRFTELENTDYNKLHSYQRDYVRTIFKEAHKLRIRQYITRTSNVETGIKMIKNIYTPKIGFKYSSRIISSIVVTMVAVYKISFILIYVWSSLWDAQSAIFDLFLRKEEENLPDELKKESLRYLQLLADELGLFPSKTYKWPDFIYYLSYVRDHVEVVLHLFVISLVIALWITILHILHFLRTHRHHLHLIQTGKYRGPTIQQLTPSRTFAESLRFMGYLTGYQIWGFLVHFFFILFILIVVSELFILPIAWNYTEDWIFDELLKYGLIAGSTLAIYYLQNIVSYLIFMQNTGSNGTKNNSVQMTLTNRRFYLILLYVFYFYNVIVGIMSCLVRVLKQVLFGIFFLSRLDHSTLARLFEMYDPGYMSYAGFLLSENIHTNPIMVTFVSLLQEVIEKKIDKPNGVCVIKLGQTHPTDNNNRQIWYSCNRPRKARNRWLVAYTLLANPQLRYQRITNTFYKEMMKQADKLKAKELGLKMGLMGMMKSDVLPVKYLISDNFQ